MIGGRKMKKALILGALLVGVMGFIAADAWAG
jgi:hypothetical protein